MSLSHANWLLVCFSPTSDRQDVKRWALKRKKKRSVFSSNSIISFLFSFYRSAVFVNSSVFVKKRDNKKKKQHTAESFFFFLFLSRARPVRAAGVAAKLEKGVLFFFPFKRTGSLSSPAVTDTLSVACTHPKGWNNYVCVFFSFTLSFLFFFLNAVLGSLVSVFSFFFSCSSLPSVYLLS